ncbi:MAG: response regulator [Chloroflexi bacterium]|nr:response regulator [Chloroflexota bacterium]
MENEGQPTQGTEPLGDRLSRLSQASLRINESLDVDTALRAVMDSARSLTDAPYAAIITQDDSGRVQDYLVLGFDPGDMERLWQAPQGQVFFEYLNALTGSLRRGRLEEFTRSIGFAEFRSPVTITAFIAAPILHQGVRVGTILVGSDEPGREFTQEDEETMVMFASQAALVIANTRRHRDEQRARAGLETLIDISPVGVVVFDIKTGASVSFNREARRIVDGLRDPGQTPEDLLGLMTVRRADGREFSLAEFPIARMLGSTETVRAEEIVMAAPDGRSVTVLLNATPIRSGAPSGEGEVESVVVTMQDMSAVEEQERLRAEFLAMVSHELRMPLAAVKGSIATLLESAGGLDPAEMRQFFRIIADRTDHMRELIGDLLDVARIETGTLPVDPEPAEVAALVDRARNVFASAGGRNQLAMEIAPDLPLVLADRQRIVQVIGNLLSNAARHSPEDSVIRVSAVRQGGHVEVSVADRGRGIPAEDLPRLFRRFSGTEGDDSGSGGNTGLGLAICKGIVEAHGGRIRAESDGPGLGARFAFTLPEVREAEPARRAARSQSGGQSAGTVLVVDDDPLMLRSVRETLTAAGFRPMVTADPEEALSLMGEHSPRLALLDLMLPERDGEELMGDLLAVSRIPVIFLSAYGRDEVVARLLEQGATDYIAKPFSPTELVARVRAALRRVGEPQFPGPAEPFALGGLTIDYAARSVTVSGRPAALTPIEFDLLAALAVEAGRVVTHDRLLRRVWSPGKPGSLRALRTHLKHLRRKLGDDAANPTYIFAEPRVGYRMAAGEEEGATGADDGG